MLGALQQSCIESFIGALDRDVWPDVAPSDELATALAEILATARAAWPALSPENHAQSGAFAAYLAARVNRSSPDASISQALARLHTDDLFLAHGCAQGQPEALAAFEGHCLTGIAATVGRVDSDPAFIDEVRQQVRHKLLLKRGEPAPRITRYRGAGSLRAWVQVTAARIALDLKRADRPDRKVPVDELADIEHGDVDPQVAYLKTQYRSEFRSALNQAFSELNKRDRALLRLQLEGLSHERIASFYHVHQSTVSRWLHNARCHVRRQTIARLKQQLGVGDTQEVHSIARLVMSQLQVGLTTMLQDSNSDVDAESR